MGFFDSVDGFLHNGGSTALDVAGFIPGLNIATEGLQAAYHGAHAGVDLLEGDEQGALQEGGSALWHGGLAALNAFTGEGGTAVREGAEAAEGASGAARVAEAAEGAGGAARVTEGAEAAQAAGGTQAAAGSTSLLSRAWNATGGRAIEAVREHGVMGAMTHDVMETAEWGAKGLQEGKGVPGVARAGLATARLGGEALDLGGDASTNAINVARGGGHVEIPGTGELPGYLLGHALNVRGEHENEEHPEAGETSHTPPVAAPMAPIPPAPASPAALASPAPLVCQ